jgi:hypothetical protein
MSTGDGAASCFNMSLSFSSFNKEKQDSSRLRADAVTVSRAAFEQ